MFFATCPQNSAYHQYTGFAVVARRSITRIYNDRQKLHPKAFECRVYMDSGLVHWPLLSGSRLISR